MTWRIEAINGDSANGNFMTGRNWVKAFSDGTEFRHSTSPMSGIDHWDGFDHPFFTEIAPLPMGLDVATTLYLITNESAKFHVEYR